MVPGLILPAWKRTVHLRTFRSGPPASPCAARMQGRYRGVADHGAASIAIQGRKTGRANAPGFDTSERSRLECRFARRMKVKSVWTLGRLLATVRVGAGDDELKRRVWD